MATYAQRAVTICDTLLNVPATNAQRDRIAKAFASALPSDATQAQIAEQFIKELRQYVLSRVQAYETDVGVAALRDTKAAQVILDFAETP